MPAGGPSVLACPCDGVPLRGLPLYAQDAASVFGVVRLLRTRGGSMTGGLPKVLAQVRLSVSRIAAQCHSRTHRS
jgi:hypothetical protein